MPNTVGRRFAHSLPHPPWKRLAVASAAVSLLVLSLAVLSVLSVGSRPRLAGGSGAGQFIVQCHSPVRVGAFDPIVSPGTAVFGHFHEFYGNQSIAPDSNYLSMTRGLTACDAAGDTAGYWHPTLLVNGVRLAATRLTAYYIAKSIPTESFPPNLRMIAGSKLATAPQDTSVVYWGCGNGSGISGVNTPPQCRSGEKLTLHILFPDCWSGTSLYTADQSHVAYSGGSSCPPGYPHRLPQLVMRLEWASQPDPKTLTLSSGSVNTMHGDFFQTWDQARLDRVVAYCINGGRQCTADDVIAQQGAPK